MSTETTMNHFQGVKRKIGSIQDDLEASDTKREKLMPTTTTRYYFEECHLNMLRSLYHTNDELEIIWNQIDNFLQQRSSLLQAKRQQQLLQGIHDEAQKYVQQNNKSQSNQTTTTTSSNVIQTPQQQQQHHYHHLTASPLSMFSPTTSIHRRHANNINSLALVARLLGQRASHTKQQQSNSMPFSSLKQETNKQIEQLNTSLEALRQEQVQHYEQQVERLAHESDDSSTIRNAATEQDARTKGKLVETEAKIQLWNMLAHSLQQIE